MAAEAHRSGAGLTGAERILGLDGEAPPPADLHFPERTIDAPRALGRLRDFCVSVETTDR